MEKIEVIKRYQGRLGEITITRYIHDENVEYHVKHSNPVLTAGEWYGNKRDAIVYYQFLCGKY